MYSCDDYDWEPAPLPIYVEYTNPCTWEVHMNSEITRNDSEQNERIRGLEVRVDIHDRQIDKLFTTSEKLATSTANLQGSITAQGKWFWGVNVVLLLAIAAGLIKMFMG